MIEVRESSRSSAKFATLTGPEAPVVALPSWLNRATGSLNFRGSRKSTPFAAQSAAETAAKVAIEHLSLIHILPSLSP